MDIKNHDIAFPSCWEELSPSEWKYLLKLAHLLKTREKLSLEDVLREWARFVLRGRGMRNLTGTDNLVLIHELGRTLTWMWKEDEGKMLMLTYDSTLNLFPSWRCYRGPLSHGADLSFGEFRHAMAVANDYTLNHAPASLDALAGILYRKRGDRESGAWREPFNAAFLERYTRRTAPMPAYLKWGVYVWFSAFCHFLLSGTFVIDGNEACFEPLFGSSGEETGDKSLGLDSILYSVAESGVFGNISETDRAPLLKVLMKLLDDYYKAEHLKKELKQ